MKKFLCYLVVLLSVCVAMVLFLNLSSCLAYSYDDFIAFSETVSTLDQADSDTHLAANWFLTNKDRIRSELASSINNFDTFIVWYTPSTSFYRFVGFQGGTFSGWRYSETTSILSGYISNNGRCQGNGSWWKYIDGRNSTYRYGLFSENIADTIDFTGRIGNNYYSTFDMSFTHGYSEDLNFNGEVVQAVKLNYNNTRLFIETVTGYEEATKIKAKLDNFDLDFVDYAGTGQIAKYQLLSRLNYNQIYNLVVSCLYDGEAQEISEKIVFVPDGTIIENGSITYYPSGDGFTTQNATNSMLNYLSDSGDVSGIFNNFFSGDTETIANNLSYPDIPYTNYWMPIYNFAVGICDTLQASGDTYLDFHLPPPFGVSRRVYASEFKTPDNPIFQFVSASLVFGVIFELYVQFKDFIYFLNTANFHEAIKQLDSDENQLWRM